jgi:EmrB/QacA subfamily drug resistance transporter
VPVAQRRWVLFACILASSMAFVDGSALTVALPALRDDFGASFATVQWILNGYVLALAALTMVGGALADVYGKDRILMIGCALFGVTSAICAYAPTAEILILARVGQGIAAALLTPASLALIGAVYPKEERNRAIGVWAAASALTTAGGPVLGGWLTESFGWQAIFLINPPLALVAVLVLLRFAPRQVLEHRRFDLVGALLLATGLALLAFAVSMIAPSEADHSRAANSGTLLPVMIFTASVFALGAFWWWQTKAKEPMAPPHLFRHMSFAGLNIATVFLYFALSVMFFVLPFRLIETYELSATTAGLLFLPFTLSVGFLSQWFGGLADRLGVKPMLIAGSLLAALGYGLFLIKTQSIVVSVVMPMSVLGIAFAIIVAPLTAAVMSSVSDRDEALASGINNTASRIAQMLGVALAAAVAGLDVGYDLAMMIAAVFSVLSAIVIILMVRTEATQSA